MILATLTSSDPWVIIVGSSLIGAIAGWVIKTVLPAKATVTKIEPPTIEVKQAVRMATWEELQAIKTQCDLCRADFRAEIVRLTNKLDVEMKEMSRQSSIARKSIYDTIREVEAVVHRIEGKME